MEVLQISLFLFSVGHVVLHVKSKILAMLDTLTLAFVVEAEKIYSDKEGFGEVKFSLVSDWLWQSVPIYLKHLVSTKDMERLIDRGVERLRRLPYLS